MRQTRSAVGSVSEFYLQQAGVAGEVGQYACAGGREGVLCKVASSFSLVCFDLDQHQAAGSQEG